MSDPQELQNQIDPELKAIASQPLTHDRLFREVFAWKELASAFLEFVLPKTVLEKLDIENLTVEPNEFLNVIFRETRADMVYRVPLKSSVQTSYEQALRVYVLLEHKSYNDHLAIFQADQYAGQIGQNEVRQAQDEKRLNQDFRLSPVLVILFHHGESAFTGPSDVSGVYEDYGVLAEFLPRRQAIIFDLNRLKVTELPTEPPELHAVLRIMQVIFQTEVGTTSREILERLRPLSEVPKYRRLIRFLWFYVLSSARRMSKQAMSEVTETVQRVIGERDMTTILEQYRTEWTLEGEARGRAEGEMRGRAEGIAEGEMRGKAEGKSLSILAVLKARFHDVPKTVADKVLAIEEIDMLDALTVNAATCQSLDDFSKSLP